MEANSVTPARVGEWPGQRVALFVDTQNLYYAARDVYSPELSDEEVLGLLRLAQLRLTEQLAWDVPSPQATALSDAPELVPLTSLFPGWEFETVDDVANVTAVWALIETIDDEGTVTWVQRESDGLALGELLSLIAVRVTGTEERLLADWGLSDLLAAEEEAGGGAYADEDYAEGEWIKNAETGELEWHPAEGGPALTADQWEHAGEEPAETPEVPATSEPPEAAGAPKAGDGAPEAPVGVPPATEES